MISAEDRLVLAMGMLEGVVDADDVCMTDIEDEDIDKVLKLVNLVLKDIIKTEIAYRDGENINDIAEAIKLKLLAEAFKQEGE